MLEGLEVSETKYSDTFNLRNDTKRFDPEFFRKSYSQIEQAIEKNEFAFFDELIEFITDGKHGGVTFTEDGVLFIRNTNIKANEFSLEDKKFISIDESEETLRAELSEGDILVTTIGSIIGESVVIPKGFPRATINQNLVKITPKDKSYTYYLSSFLNSRYGNLQVYKYSVGNIWLLLNYPNLKKLKVPLFSTNFYKEIENAHILSISYLNEYIYLYAKAENLLLQELGLVNWQPTIKNNNTKTIKESFLQSGRIDAEYYQPKYDELENAIKGSSYSLIKDIRSINYRGLQPEYVQDGTLDVINSKHILETTLDYDNFEKTSTAFWDLQESEMHQ